MDSCQDTALRALLSRRAMLIGYILSIVRDPHLAEDIFQNVALLVVKKGIRVETEAGFISWLRKTARYQALNAMQKQSNAPRPLDESVLESLEEHWRARDVDPSSTSVDALRECLKTLTPRARRLVDLRYGENLDGSRLSEILSRPLNTVYVALSRIHRTLAECVNFRLSREGISHG